MSTIIIVLLLLIVSITYYWFFGEAINKSNKEIDKKLAKLYNEQKNGLERKVHIRDLESKKMSRIFVVVAPTLLLVFIAFIVLALNMYTIVTAGHNKVPIFLGKVVDKPLSEGFHIVNPILEFHEFDLRDITYNINDIAVPSQDKLKSKFDVSFIIAANHSYTPKMFQTAGNLDMAVDKYLVPKARSLLREAGKTVKESQEFFKDEIQVQMQTTLEEGMKLFLAEKGFNVKSVLIRDIDLPSVIKTAIIATKERQEEVNQEQAKLDKIEKQAQQQVVQSAAKAEAAINNANAIKTLADAEAYRIEAEATAKAISNIKLAKSITSPLISYNSIEKWNGSYPQTLMSGADSGVLLNLPPNK